ncbi:helix-turn-helix transcriptional regulator [uncultured Flavobacterium sp.]|uniref:helix-turn-helix domain-containing protein n=1 Tax=uncultured Flavobacterium sp. TaxID=165435 RepID=UPI00292F8E1A|nr:helix-turn-helix transcriptional regulator [uncultured Flavobacterium sp.]
MGLILDFILITGILLCIIILIGLFKLKLKQIPHKILIVFWSIIMLSLLHFYTMLHNLDSLFAITYVFENGSRFILAPLIYVYIKSLLPPPNKAFIKNHLFHFIPFIVYFVFYILPVIILTKIIKKDFYPYLNFIDENFNQGLWQDLFSLFYFYLSLRLFFRVKKGMTANYSNFKEKDFLWIKKFIYSFLIVIILDLTLVFLSIFGKYNGNELGFITMIFTVISMIYLGYYGLTQSSIFLPDFLTNEKPANRQINPEELTVLKRKVTQALEEEKLYLSPDLTLRTLANSIELSERKLSSLINDEMNTTFYDLINNFRVQEAKKRLKSSDYNKYTVVAIGDSCGFNSKSSFYRIFKSETSLTPTQFKNS